MVRVVPHRESVNSFSLVINTPQRHVLRAPKDGNNLPGKAGHETAMPVLLREQPFPLMEHLWPVDMSNLLAYASSTQSIKEAKFMSERDKVGSQLTEPVNES